ncbi:cyclase [Allosaccharopolyspora coralli]|uniref:Cyclase n=2 Tax=Allosaccharopolyspora coralli TaxID=2665642 RepID=A0A5Q3QEN0_9PSEU|nr:cyclase [Allosaccharopolyspora coralli]
MERLFQEAENYVTAKAQNLVSAAGDKLGETTQQLTEAAEGDGLGSLIGQGGKKLAEGKSALRAAMEVAGKGLKDKVKEAFTGGGSKGKGSSSGKFNNIVEDVDVGVPVRTAFDQWVNYQEFGGFTRGVLSVDHVDEVTTNWNAKVAKSKRSWKATVSEQIPDERIVWNTEGAKGTIRGVVTFHPIGENLTRVLLVIEYYPSGFFEKTANMWWAASRRVRLDLKHYRRFIMMQGEPTDEGWRGTIRDGEVVQSHEDAVQAEQEEQESDEHADEDTDDEFEDSDEEQDAGDDQDFADEDADYDEDGESEEDSEADHDEEDDLEEDEEDYEHSDEDEYDEDAETDEDDEDLEAEPDEDEAEEEPEARRAPRRPRRRSRAPA